MNENSSKSFLRIMEKFLLSNGSWGLDIFQAKTLSSLLNDYNKKVYLITAPTGSGKTIIFGLYIIAKLIKAAQEGRNEKVVIVYPRKALSVDQMNRFLKLVDIARSEGYNFTLALRDGSTPKVSELNIGDEYRGLTCYLCNSPIVIGKISGRFSARCKKCKKVYDFLLIAREEMGTFPDILITNMWTLETRIMDSEINDVNVNYFKSVGLIVIDEVHEYRSLGAGLVSGLIRLVINISNSKAKVLLSSATLPSPVEYAVKFTGFDGRYISSNEFHELVRGIELGGKRLVIVGLYDINPRYSWSTYSQLWAIYHASIYYAYKYQRKGFLPQAILFINNIKELRRVLRGIEENINLGEPYDHLYKIREPLDPYSYTPYFSSSLLERLENLFNDEGRIAELRDLIGEMHSEVAYQDRKKILHSLKSGGPLAVTVSTSSLELGVDYDNVSFILNVGLDSSISLTQRIGRGGRSFNCLRTVMGIILTKKIPQEAFAIYDINIWNKLHPSPKKFNDKIRIASDNPQVMKRTELIKIISELAGSGHYTYVSYRALNNIDELKKFLSKIVERGKRT